MSQDTATLCRGPDSKESYSLVEPGNRYVGDFKSSLPGGSAAKACCSYP